MKSKRTWIYLVVGLMVGLSTLPAHGLPLGVRILDSEEVLRDRTLTGVDGLLYLQDQMGTLRRFVTSVNDPIIANPGDGMFHPAPAPAVRAAIEAADPRFMDRIQFDVYLLPFPVADPLGSWADGGAIYLSPGVRALADRQVHFLLSHEAGHLVHRTFLPDGDLDGWARYRRIRGIEDSTRYNAGAIHRDRPREIFAEDFRVLFGSAWGYEVDPIENPELASPDVVPGLRDFFLGLIGASETAPSLAVTIYPNPIATGDILRLALPAASAPQMAIYDVQGRRIRNSIPLGLTGEGTFATQWDGRDEAGRILPRGVYYFLVRDGARTARIPILHTR